MIGVRARSATPFLLEVHRIGLPIVLVDHEAVYSKRHGVRK